MAAPTLVKTREVIEAYIAQGLCVGAQVSTKVEGKEQHDLVVGEVRENVPMQKDVLMHMMSITKVVGVVAIGQLLDRKLITINDRVAKHIPEFGKFGKELIRIEHLLTHTAGIPYADAAMWTKLHMTDEVLRVIYDSKLEHGWQPGRKAGYHAYSAWFLLGEIVRRVDGRPFEQYAMEEIFKPLGMTDTHVSANLELPCPRYRHTSASTRVSTPTAHVGSEACRPNFEFLLLPSPRDNVARLSQRLRVALMPRSACLTSNSLNIRTRA